MRSTSHAIPIRLLVATDVAAEGLNLQTSCRYVVHYEVPWNPMRLEQRNGRVDRHGQARDVTAFHFTSDEDEDVKFLDYVVNKVDQVRDDLGSVGEVIDRGSGGALRRRAADRRGARPSGRASCASTLPNGLDLPEPRGSDRRARWRGGRGRARRDGPGAADRPRPAANGCSPSP